MPAIARGSRFARSGHIIFEARRTYDGKGPVTEALSPTGTPWQCSQLDLDGAWELVIGDGALGEVFSLPEDKIEVPGLWEVQGHLGLDGTAWYRRRFDVHDPAGWWTLHFGAVMDDADVFLNGKHVGAHRGGFTPFALDCTGLVRPSGNELAVRVVDHPRGSAAHRRSAHGKQGWMNDVFPSPPSLYLDYGGIWQSVSLERHGPVRVDDCWVNDDPDDLVVTVSPAGADEVAARVVLRTLGRCENRDVDLSHDPSVHFQLGAAEGASRWSPAHPALHDAVVTVYVDERVSHQLTVRFGLRRIEVRDGAFELQGVPFEMRSALVQGFSARTLYGSTTRAEAEAEVAAAQALGLNTLRLHIKAFDPVYLDVCDERGMLVHCDIPIAEPIAHDELGADGVVAEQCLSAAVEQVRRDRNHPSIVLWSVMNELGAEQLPVRQGPGYEGFTRRLYRAVRETDPTRPVIENDWPEPDPAHVFESPILTAHWYGRLSPWYSSELSEKLVKGAAGDRPLFVSEFGDWGLPGLDGDHDEFWGYTAQLTELIESTPWPYGAADFVAGTQRYQGLADRLQIELFRRTPGVMGWCVTELTDVPQEFNGLFDLGRRRKEPACEELRVAAQPVCPIIVRPHWSVAAGEQFRGEVVVVNDGPALDGAEIIVRLQDDEWRQPVDLPAYGKAGRWALALPAPRLAGGTRVDLQVRQGRRVLGGNYYPLRVVARRDQVPSITGVTDPVLRGLFAGLGATTRPGSGARPGQDLLVIAEGSLTSGEDPGLHDWLAAGGDALLLAQRFGGALPIPVAAHLVDLETAWGSTPFVFTTSEPALTALPAASVLASELLSTAPQAVFTRLGGGPFPAKTAVGVLKPPPGPVVGTVVGRLPVLAGRLTVCQLPLTGGAAAGDPLCLALLGDVLHWASQSNF